MEYALLVALIAVVCIASVTFLGSSASGKFNGAGSGIDGSSTPVATTAPALPTTAYDCVQAGYYWKFGHCQTTP